MIAIDLPGLGLTDRPEDFNYVFSNFGRFCNRFLDVLKIEKIHLLVHDVGAPIGLAMAAQNSNRINSITVLNAMLDVEHLQSLYLCCRLKSRYSAKQNWLYLRHSPFR
jgi:pimeloyl-ACP methyl ester carboxylesterase